MAADWLSLNGNGEHSFASGGTEQFAAQINVPNNANIGTYSLSLQVVGVENPDEDFAQGPTVTFDVEEASAPEPKKFSWWIVAAVVGVLVLAIGGFFLVRSLLADDPLEGFVLFEEAPNALWKSEAGNLSFGGAQDINTSFAGQVTNFRLEDGATHSAIVMEPAVGGNSNANRFVRGDFQDIAIEEGSHFNAQIGRVQQPSRPHIGQLDFNVYVNDRVVHRGTKAITGEFTDVDVDLSLFAGQPVTIGLEVVQREPLASPQAQIFLTRLLPTLAVTILPPILVTPSPTRRPTATPTQTATPTTTPTPLPSPGENALYWINARIVGEES